MNKTNSWTMLSSASSSLADDSGVQCDMGQSITDAEDLACDGTASELLEKSITWTNLPDIVKETEKLKCDTNGNMENVADDEIVHRRRCKKAQSKNPPKKRVSFHEDILNSTKIDDVHIDRGFISYRGNNRFGPVVRNSWSSSGDSHLQHPHKVMSDLLTYGATDANTLFSPNDDSNQQSETSSNASSPLNEEQPFKSFSCDYFGESPPQIKKQFHSEGDVSHKKQSIKSVLKKRNYLTTSVVDETDKKSKNKIKVLESLKSFYNTFKLGLSSTTSGVLEEPLAVEASVNNELQTKIVDDFVQIQMDDHTSTSHTTQTIKEKLTLNMNNKQSEILGEKNFVVNCESTVYEHKGLSYTYTNDTFQTTFDANKERFTPIPEVDNENYKSLETSMISVDDKSNQLPTSFNLNDTNSSVFRDIAVQLNEKKLLKVKEATSKHLSSPRKQRSLKPNNDQKTDSTLDLNSESEKLSEFDDVDVSKQSILNRFLRNFQKRSYSDKVLKNNAFYERKARKNIISLIYNKKLVENDIEDSSQKLDKMIAKEVMENRRISVRVMTSSKPSYFDSFEDDFALECYERVKIELFTQSKEQLHRLVRGRVEVSSDEPWKGVAALVTSHAIRFATRNDDTKYIPIAVIPYHHLQLVQVGPEGQYVILESKDGAKVNLITGDGSLTDRFVTWLMWAAALLNCHPEYKLLEESAKTLYVGAVCVAKDKKVMKGEAENDSEAPIDGYLMYKTSQTINFIPAHFSLTSGVLRWEESAIDLRKVLGARRIELICRPHCFQLAYEKEKSLILAAADDLEASLWLQAILQHAARALETEKSCKKRNDVPMSAFVKIFDDSIKVMDSFSGKVLLNGPHSTLLTVKLPCDGGDRCQLEWWLCEAESSGTGKVTLIFSCGNELDRFLAALENAYKVCVGWYASFPLNVCSTSSKNNSCDCVDSNSAKIFSQMMEQLLPHSY